MAIVRGALALMFACGAVACVEDRTDDAGDAASGDGGGADGGIDAAAEPGDAAADDAATHDGAARDAARDPPDSGPDAAMTPVTDCAEACARFAACGLEDDLFGDEASCVADCEESDVTHDLSDWMRCVGAEACNTLRRCRLPAPPPPTCDEACALVEGCGADVPFDCPATCADGEESFVACASAFGDGCGLDAFWSCLGDGLFRGCGHRCVNVAACNLEVPVACVESCIREGFDDDPLRRRRSEQRNACVQLAGDDCARVEACLGSVVEEPALPVNMATFCDLWNACPVAQRFPCDVAWSQVSQPGLPATVAECAIHSLQAGCPADPFQVLELCLRGGVPPRRGPGCVELCEARDLCGRLDEDRAVCLADCSADLQAGADAAERRALEFPCGAAASCPELDTCLAAADPEAACDRHCAALTACGAGDGCDARCDAEFVRDRHAAWRECVEGAGDCAAIAACAPARGLPCELECARLEGCGNLGPEGIDGCVGECDDRQFADPAGAAQRFACILTAPACFDNFGGHAVDRCTVDPSAGGGACHGYCRAVSDSCGGDRAFDECLTTCGAGFTGEGLVRFAAAEACLEVRDPTGECGALQACVADEPAIDCGAWCGGLEGCALEDEACEARCDGDALARLRAIGQVACVRTARDDCDAIAACADLLAPIPPPVDEAQFCAVYQRCDFERVFPCQQVLEIAAGRPGSLRCAFDALVEDCPRDAGDVFDMCLRGGADPRVGACFDLCEARAACDALDGADTAGCRIGCSEAFMGDPELAGRAEATLACAEARSCGALDACIAANGPEGRCAAHCAALSGCGLAAGDCAEACDRGFPRARQAVWRACVAAADGCGAIEACAPAAAAPCAEYCDRVAGECGLARPDGCETTCDDAHFRDPLDVIARVACALTADACSGPGHTVEVCVFQEDPAQLPGGECLAWCRLGVECAGDDDRALVDCVSECSLGFGGREALEFHAARACLGRVGAAAACDALEACRVADVQVDCEDHCARQDACGIAAEDCVEACAGAPDVDAAACVLEAGRLRGGCAAVAACVGFVAPPVAAACASLCNRQAECSGVDGFVCRLGCEDSAEVQVRAACASVSLCGDLGACLALDGAEVPACAGPCAAAVACGGFADEAACGALCAGRVQSPDAPAGFVEEVVACVDDLGDECRAEEAAACFMYDAHTCEAACDLLGLCGAIDPGDPSCVQGCLEEQRNDPARNEQIRGCVFEFLGGGQCDLNNAIACFDDGRPPPDRPDEPPPPPPPPPPE